MSSEEKLVGAVFFLVAILWIAREWLTPLIPGISDPGIAIAGALLLFVLPAKSSPGSALIKWRDTTRLPWGILILFGGGFSLAFAIQTSGLAAWIGESLSGLANLPVLVVLLAMVTVIVFLTELTSNVATTAAFLPVLASIAPAIGQNPMLLLVPATLAASAAFMLPVATPPNAIMYGSGHVSIRQMARAGFALNIIFIFLVVGLTYFLLPFAFDVTPGVVPSWASSP